MFLTISTFPHLLSPEAGYGCLALVVLIAALVLIAVAGALARGPRWPVAVLLAVLGIGLIVLLIVLEMDGARM